MNSPQYLADIQCNQRIRVKHPFQGELTLYVFAMIEYEELWQKQRGAQSPWVPTGKIMRGFWLETDKFLLNWLNRFYILDEVSHITDTDIARDFAPHARKFAQSDQTAEVYFAYPPASWKIVDIGKFRIRSLAGTQLSQQPGGIGRFIHCSGSDQRALVVEDSDGGGGQDAVWNGYQIEESDIQN